MCQVLVRCVSVSRSVNVSSNKVSVVELVFHKKTRSRYLFSSRKLSGALQTSCTRLVKLLIVVALCEVVIHRTERQNNSKEFASVLSGHFSDNV